MVNLLVVELRYFSEWRITVTTGSMTPGVAKASEAMILTAYNKEKEFQLFSPLQLREMLKMQMDSMFPHKIWTQGEFVSLMKLP